MPASATSQLAGGEPQAPARKNRKLLAVGSAVLCAACLLVGCGSTVRFREQNLPELAVVPLPLSAIVYQDKALLEYEHVEGEWYGAYKWRPGPAIASAFNDVFEASFEQLKIVDQLAVDHNYTNNSDVLIVPRIKMFSSSVFTEIEIQTIKLTIDVDLKTPAEEHIDTVSVSGWVKNREIEFSDIFGGVAYFRTPAELAIRNAAAEFASTFRESPDFKKWLEERNAYRSALPNADIVSLPASDMDGSWNEPAAGIGTLVILSDIEDHSKCLQRSMLEANSALKFMPQETFRNEFFPWFDGFHLAGFVQVRSSAVMDRWNTIRQSPLIAERIKKLNLTHVIVINGATTMPGLDSLNDKSWGGCAGGPTGGLCMGMQYADKSSRLWAEVIEVSESAPLEAQAIEHTVTDQIVWPNILIPFIPIIPNTDKEACEFLGRELATRVLAENVNQPE